MSLSQMQQFFRQWPFRTLFTSERPRQPALITYIAAIEGRLESSAFKNTSPTSFIKSNAAASGQFTTHSPCSAIKTAAREARESSVYNH